MHFSSDNLALIIKAYAFAARCHAGQRRKGCDHEPYINHLTDVAEKLWEIGAVRDVTVIAAGILHDTIEDTELTEEQLAVEFNVDIAAIVMEVTDDMSLPNAERKRLQIEHASSLSPRARLVKIADKISNIEDVISNPPVGWDDKRKRAYIEWGHAVVGKIRGTNDGLERWFDEVCAVRDGL